MPTIAEVRKSFEDELQAIFTLDQELAAERAALKRAAFLAGRELTPQEVARRKEIAATRHELSDALSALSLETVDALESASDVDALLAAVNTVNRDLRDDLNRLQELARHAEQAAKVAAGLASIATKLAALRPTLV